MAKTSNPEKKKPLRERAEEMLRASPTDISQMAAKEVHALLHELQVHEMELQIQNEELRQAQVELAEARDRYSDLFEFAPVGYLTLDKDGRILAANLTAASMLGVNRQDLVKAKLSDFVDCGAQDDLFLHQREVFQSGEPQSCELAMPLPDGTKLHARLDSVADFDGGSPQIRVTLADVTARKRAELLVAEHQETLIHMGRVQLVGEMSSNITHEVNQPLLVITLQSEICSEMLETLPDSDELRQVREALKKITEQSQRAGRVINFLRRFSAKQQPHRASHDVNELIHDVRRQLAEESKRHDVRLRLDLLRGACPVLVDRIQIEQVLINLLHNAFDELQANELDDREVLVSTSESDAMIHVCVSDNGAGIRATDLDRVFDSFYTTKPAGLGLGLSICRTIIESHDGEIWAKSNPRRGVAIEFQIPRHADTTDK